MSLPRTEEHLIRDHVKFRVGKIVYASISPDETTLGFGFPKEERAALIDSQPDRFLWPKLSDQRFHWIVARMAALDPDEMRELIIDAWRMVVPKKVAAAHLRDLTGRPGPVADASPGRGIRCGRVLVLDEERQSGGSGSPLVVWRAKSSSVDKGRVATHAQGAHT